MQISNMQWDERLGNIQSEQFTSLANRMAENLRILFASVGGTHGREPRVRVTGFSQGR